MNMLNSEAVSRRYFVEKTVPKIWKDSQEKKTAVESVFHEAGYL